MKAVAEDRWDSVNWGRFATVQAYVRHRDLHRSPAGTKFGETNARLIHLPEQQAAVFAATYWEAGLVMGDHVYKEFRDLLGDYGVRIAGEASYPPLSGEDLDWTRVIVMDMAAKTSTGCDVDLEFLLGEYNKRTAWMAKFTHELADPRLYEVNTEHEDDDEEFNEWMQSLSGRIQEQLPELEKPCWGMEEHDDDEEEHDYEDDVSEGEMYEDEGSDDDSEGDEE